MSAVVLALLSGVALPEPLPLSSPFAVMPRIEYPSLVCVDLVAGQLVPGPDDLLVLGDVCVEDDGTVLRVRYRAASGWLLAETQLAIARSREGFPLAGPGNPLLGRFPHRTTHPAETTSFVYTIALRDLNLSPGVTVLVAAHASLLRGATEEGAWGRGVRFTPEGNPAMYFSYTVSAGRSP